MSPPTINDICPAFHLRLAARSISQYFDTILRINDVQVRIGQLMLLEHLNAHPDSSSSFIGKTIGTHHSTISRLLKPLENYGWISNEHTKGGKKKRDNRYTLSDTGKQLLDNAKLYWTAAIDEVATSFGAARYEALITELCQFSKIVHKLCQESTKRE